MTTIAPPPACARKAVTYNREAQLLLDCAHPAPDAQTQARLQTLPKTGIDWQLFLDAAELHGLVPLAYLNLKRFCHDSVPQNIMDRLNVAFVRHTRLSLRMLDELKMLLDKLSAQGIAAVPFKGPHLAQKYYRDLVLRTFCDLDLWVRKQDVAATQRCLKEFGYKPCPSRGTVPDENFLLSGLFRKLCFEYTYEKGAESSQCYVDLHWKILPPDLLPISESELQNHIRKEFLWDMEVPSFDNEMTLLFVCAHGCKHAWTQISWVVDAAQIVKEEAIDWLRLFQLAERHGAYTMLLSGLFLAQQFMLLDLPDELIERLKRANIAASCGEIVERFMENPISPPWKELKRWLFLISLMSGWNRLTFIVRRCIQPTLDEWLALPLPAPLFSLYFILRPFKLLVDHVPRILKRLLLGGYDMRLNIRS